jgi:hypothetical protein
MLLRKTLFVSLVDLTNSWKILERGFLLICFVVFEVFIDSILHPYQEDSLMIMRLRTL